MASTRPAGSLPPNAAVTGSSRFLVEVESSVRPFPRYHRHTIGCHFRFQAMKVCRLAAHTVQSRTARACEHLLEQLVWQVEEVKMSLQLGKELEFFATTPIFPRSIGEA